MFFPLARSSHPAHAPVLYNGSSLYKKRSREDKLNHGTPWGRHQTTTAAVMTRPTATRPFKSRCSRTAASGGDQPLFRAQNQGEQFGSSVSWEISSNFVTWHTTVSGRSARVACMGELRHVTLEPRTRWTTSAEVGLPELWQSCACLLHRLANTTTNVPTLVKLCPHHFILPLRDCAQVASP